MASGNVSVSPGMLETNVIVAPNSPESAGERQQNPGDDAGQGKGQRDRREYPGARAAQRLGRRFETLIDGVDGKANRADHQRKSHDCRGERGAGPAEGEDDAEPFVEPASDRTVLAEQHKEREADDDGREHERKVNESVEQDLSGKARSRKHVGDQNGKRQAENDAYKRHPQTEQNDADLFGCSVRAFAI